MTPLSGEVPSPANPPPGCYFHPRCPHAVEICAKQPPALEETTPGHFVSCHRARELALPGIGLPGRRTPATDQPGATKVEVAPP
jgi:hypothetical protein